MGQEANLAWIKWPPQTQQSRFPKFLKKDPLDLYYPDIQSESCSVCGFTVEWVIGKENFEDHNDGIRRTIKQILTQQKNRGDCPEHPKPQWLK